MKTWLLITLDERERLYRGHGGYDDELRSVYRYDSFVPNHKQVAPGDAVVLRGKDTLLGCAVIEAIDSFPGAKLRLLCRSCGSPKLKERKNVKPKYRCECGATFDTPTERSDDCVKYVAKFGISFQPLSDEISIDDLWKLAPRLNKQLAMLEIDSEGTARRLRDAMVESNTPDSLPTATAPLFTEGARISVLVNRYERDPRVRAACIAHYGCQCCVCGFIFSDSYGSIGEGVIEVHHLERLADRGERDRVDPISDLRPLCSNCHTVAHRRTPPFSIEELREILGNQSDTHKATPR